MNYKLRKTTLVGGMSLSLLMGGAWQSFALPSTIENVHSVANAQQTKSVTIVVNDEMGPVIGANVIVKGTTNGNITDLDGKAVIDGVSPNDVIDISFIGYLSQEVKVGEQTSITVLLKEDSQSLEEVVVVGYGVQKKKLVTGATVQVKGDDLQKLSTTNALSALQSQTPGVNITQSNGQPGSGFKVNIRGMGTIGNFAPLYVIDGVAGGDINSLNPSDIESIDVLKDAASAAIYGARAANGVILITTKQGKSGKVQVTYDGYVGWQNVYKMPELLTAKQYMEVMDQICFNQGNDVTYTWKNYMSEDRYNAYMNGTDKGTDWLDAIRNENAPIQSHALNLVGGSETSKFSLGVGYTSQEGIFGKPVQSDYERTTVRLNSEHVILKAKDFDAITFGENMYYKYSTNSGIAVGNQYGNDISSCLRANPLVPIYNSNGDYYLYDDIKADGIDQYNSYTSNPVADMVYNHGSNISKNHDLNLTAYLKIQPIKNLIYKGQFGYKMSSSSYRNYVPVYIINQTNQNLVDRVQQSAGQGWSYTVENTINYTFDLMEKHHFDALVGQSFEKSGMGQDLSVTNSNLLFSGWDYAWISNTQSTTPSAMSGSPWNQGALASFFGRVNYDYNETYMASLILRTDGSSNFARGHRWGTFPSVSAGWVISNEKFMESTKSWMDFLKFRASWGQNGNCNIANFQYLATVAFDNTAYYSFNNNVTSYLQGSYPDILPNEEITWETSEQLDLGFDARFLNSRLSLAFDYYNKQTKDWLVQAPILASYGTGAPYINGGDVRNRGVEVALGWNDQIGDLTYGANVNFAYNQNEVTRIANDEGVIHGETKVLAENTSEIYRCEVGKPIGYFWAYKTAGIFQNQEDIDAWKAQYGDNAFLQTNVQPGDVKFVDTNNDGKITTEDKTMVGDPNPDFRLGFSVNFGYKGFDLAVTANGAFGQQIARSYRKFTDGRQENYTTEVYDYWHGEGTSNRYPRLTAGNIGVNWQQLSDIYIENGDYLKIQNVTIGYDFKNVWKTMPLSQARLYVTGQNLLTFTGYKGMDPEIGTSSNDGSYGWASGIDLGYYPSPRTILVGLNLKF